MSAFSLGARSASIRSAAASAPAAWARCISRRNNQLFLAPLGYAEAKAGRTRDALAIARELEQMSKRRYVITYRIARIHAALGRSDEAFAMLDKACDERDWFVSRVTIPAFDALRSDARLLGLTGAAIAAGPMTSR
jgi:hypothetical protein